MKTKELVLKYFNSWQEPPDFREMRQSLSPHLKIDGGFFKFEDAASFVDFIEQSHTPWKDVRLIYSYFHDNVAALLYEGVNTQTGETMRVSEHLMITDGKISEIHSVITKLP